MTKELINLIKVCIIPLIFKNLLKIIKKERNTLELRSFF